MPCAISQVTVFDILRFYYVRAVYLAFFQPCLYNVKEAEGSFSMAKKKNKKVVKYRRPLNINVGIIIFALIFAYMAFYVYTYVQRDKIEFYEVTEGSIVNDKRHTGIIFREEEVRYTDYAGNINYYMREGKKAAVGTRIYSIDETGRLSDLLAEESGDTVSLSKDNISALKKQLSSFSQTFSDENFRDVYDTKNDLDAEVLEYVSEDTLKSLDSVISEIGASFEQVSADKSGIVSYTIDSMEDLSPEDVTASMFDRTNYTRSIVKSGQLVEIHAPVYKLVTDTDWYIVFQPDDEELDLYNGKSSLTIKFTGNDLEASGEYSVITGADGEHYCCLKFSKYLEQFISERYVDFEVVTEEVKGLKIPRSSVTEVNFYLIPREFAVLSATGSIQGVLKEVYTEDGPDTVLTSISVYNSDDDYYYVGMDDSGLSAGDYLIKEDSTDRYQVGATAAVLGVYNINRGYTAFRKIEVLSSNDEYYTVKKGSSYGLSVYDHIVLDASTVTGNGMVIYQ